MNAEERADEILANPRMGRMLEGALLERADLSNAYLEGADLTGADLTGAGLRGADLTGADLTEALFNRTYLLRVSGANLTGAVGICDEMYLAAVRRNREPEPEP